MSVRMAVVVALWLSVMPTSASALCLRTPSGEVLSIGQPAVLVGSLNGVPAIGSARIETTGEARFAFTAPEGPRGLIFGTLVIWPLQAVGTLAPPEYQAGSGFVNTNGGWRPVLFGPCD